MTDFWDRPASPTVMCCHKSFAWGGQGIREASLPACKEWEVNLVTSSAAERPNSEHQNCEGQR